MPTTLYVYDEIGPDSYGLIGPTAFADALEAIGPREDLLVRVNSPGGSVFDALSIRELLSDHEGKVNFRIDGQAASAATVLAPDGAPIAIAASGRVMIHDPWTVGAFNAAEMRKLADTLDGIAGDILDIYVARVGDKSTRQQLAEWMAAETTFSAQASLDAGLVDSIVGGGNAAAAAARVNVERNKRQQLAAAKVRHGPSAIELDALKRARSPSFFKLLRERSPL